MKEICKNCKCCVKLYVPPIDKYNDFTKNGYVCTLLINDGQVMYLENNKGTCEEFQRKRNCCNCRHNIRKENKIGHIICECEVDNRRMEYFDVMEGWCRKWAKGDRYDQRESN